jgi:Subtilisin inhibitor-like
MRLSALIRTIAAAAALTAAIALAAPPAFAQTGRMILRITALTTGASRTVSLTCEPTGGTHPDAAAACQALIAADGDISRIPRFPALCINVHDPVVASAFGIWNGHIVGYYRRFENAGCANISTGLHVFDF